MQKYILHLLMILGITLPLSVTGCGGGSHKYVATTSEGYVAFDDHNNTTLIVTKSGDYVASTDWTKGDECIWVEDMCLDVGNAVDNDKFCADEDSVMDVIVIDGVIVDVICYPSPKDEDKVTEVTGQGGDTEVPQNANNTVVVFDPKTDGTAIDGDINVDGNNVGIYGNGVDETILNGNIVITGNNARIRGLTVKGNVTVEYNDASIAFCKIEGNLEVSKNNFTMASTDVFGNVNISGNNAALLLNRTKGNWNITGMNPYCEANKAFQDEDGDFIVDADEIGADLTCTAQ